MWHNSHMENRNCSVDGCDKPTKNKDLCWAHYGRYRKYGDPMLGGPPKRKRTSDFCSLDGCNKPVYAFSLCSAHYTRNRRHGSPYGGRTAYGETHAFLESLFDQAIDECITWPYAKDRKGYGVITIDGANRIVSRIVCERLYGPPPSDSHQAAHSCGHGHLGCVNPRHLRWATVSENMNDKVLHGTSNRGEANANSKLTVKDVRFIRSCRDVSQRDLAKRFGVHFTTINDIIRRKKWKWLD